MQKLIDCGCDSVAKWNKQVFQDKLVRTVLLMLVYVLGEIFDCEKLLCVINDNNVHWTLLVVKACFIV